MCEILLTTMIVILIIVTIAVIVRESFVMTEYYCKYLLSQDIGAVEYTQVIETVLSGLIVINITILLAIKRVVLMVIIFLQEKSLLTPHICLNYKPKEW